MKKTILAMFMAGLMLVTIFSALSVSAAPPGNLQRKLLGSGNSGISFWANGARSVTFENKEDSHTFSMTVKNNGGYRIEVTVSTLLGGIDGYFDYTLPDGKYIVGPYGTETLSLWVEAIGQSRDRPVPVSFTVSATSGLNNHASLTFYATTLRGDGGPPDDSFRFTTTSQIEPRHTSGNLVLY